MSAQNNLYYLKLFHERLQNLNIVDNSLVLDDIKTNTGTLDDIKTNTANITDVKTSTDAITTKIGTTFVNPVTQGEGVKDTGTTRVTIATDDTKWENIRNNIELMYYNTNVIAAPCFSGGDAHQNIDTVNVMGVVRQETPTQYATVDGKYIAMSADRYGRIYVNNVIGGNVAVSGSGTNGNGVQRVTIATDDTIQNSIWASLYDYRIVSPTTMTKLNTKHSYWGSIVDFNTSGGVLSEGMTKFTAGEVKHYIHPNINYTLYLPWSQYTTGIGVYLAYPPWTTTTVATIQCTDTVNDNYTSGDYGIRLLMDYYDHSNVLQSNVVHNCTDSDGTSYSIQEIVNLRLHHTLGCGNYHYNKGVIFVRDNGSTWGTNDYRIFGFIPERQRSYIPFSIFIPNNGYLLLQRLQANFETGGVLIQIWDYAMVADPNFRSPVCIWSMMCYDKSVNVDLSGLKPILGNVGSSGFYHHVFVTGYDYNVGQKGSLTLQAKQYRP